MNKGRLWLFVSVSILAVVAGAILLLEDDIQTELKTSLPLIPAVSVVVVQPQNNEGTIHTFAEVKPRWAITLNSRVSGEVVEVSTKALAGQVIEKGELLVRIEDSAYLVDVSEAERAVSSAKIDLTRQRIKTKRAPRDWQSMGIAAQPTALAMNKPQLDLAEKSLAVALNRLNAARVKLADTLVVAPFSGVVTARSVSIGQSVAQGEGLLHLVDNRHRDIVVSLSKPQWSMLAENWQGRTAGVRNLEGVEIARAQIMRGGGFLDQKSRQYQLFLEVDNRTSGKVLPGDYVQIHLPGRVVGNSLAIPQSGLTRSGFVWFVDDSDRLRKFAAKVAFYSGDRIVVETPSRASLGDDYPAKWRIATTPLASFLPGNRVRANLVAGK